MNSFLCSRYFFPYSKYSFVNTNKTNATKKKNSLFLSRANAFKGLPPLLLHLFFAHYVHGRLLLFTMGSVHSIPTQPNAEVHAVMDIPTAVQAEAALDRRRAQKRANYARQREKLLSGPPAEIQAYRKRHAAATKAWYSRRKERMSNDTEYRNEILHKGKVKRDAKRKAIEDDPLHVNAGKDVDRMAKVRRVAAEALHALDAQDRETLLEKVRERYFSNFSLIDLML
jgi:hypothetical protein